jgi:trigger factor
MKCEVKDINTCSKILTIDVPVEQIQDAYTLFYKQIAPRAKVPGFRPGKAPHTVVAMHYRNEAKEEVLKKLVSNAYHDAIEKHAIDPIGYPEFENVDFTDAKLSFQARVETKPVIKVKKYKGLSVKEKAYTVEDKEVDEVIERIRDGYATFVPIEDRGIELGDFAVCDMTSTIEGEEPQTKKDEWVEVKEDEMIKGFATQTIGMRPQETKEITVTLSDAFPTEALRGKKIVFNVTVNEIKKKELPALDDDFLKRTGDYASIDALREAIKKDIDARKKADADSELERALIDMVAKDVTCDLPPSLIERRLTGLVQDATKSMIQQGLAQEEADARSDQMRDRFKAEAERQVKVAFILDAIGSLEAIETVEEDIEKRFEELAKQYRQPAETIKDYYEKNDLLDSLKAEIRNQKVIDFIKASADIKK